MQLPFLRAKTFKCHEFYNTQPVLSKLDSSPSMEFLTLLKLLEGSNPRNYFQNLPGLSLLTVPIALRSNKVKGDKYSNSRNTR